LIQADGSVFPHKGRITFANASYNAQTGTFLLRATIPNPGGDLRPGQFVRVRVQGLVRSNAIHVPQQAVLQGATGHFVVLVDKDSKAQIRPVKVGAWYGDDWFITEGLMSGDVLVIDGMARVTPGAAVKAIAAPVKSAVVIPPAPAPAAKAAPAAKK
jgi:membrane fusion protein (multidrug efflux system)